MHIRLATDNDEADITAFSAAEWPSADAEHFGRADVSFEKKTYTFLAYTDTQLIGYCTIETDMGVCYVDSIITAAAARGSGVGKALMQRAEEKAVSENCHKMYLITGTDWSAKAFYESLGYTTLVTLKNHYDHKDFVYMEKFM